MKRALPLFMLLIIPFIGFSQDFKFYENFDTIPYGNKVSSSNTGAGQWGITTSFSISGLRSDSCVVPQNDTVYLTSNAFSTMGVTNLFLEFSHICKIEFNDFAEIQVSNNNGATWTKLTAAQYMGVGQFGSISDRFSCVSYVTDWDATNPSTIPTNAWWKEEKFNIGALIGNSSQARIRFMLSDQNSNGANGNYGWLLDDVRVWTPSAQGAMAISFALPLSLPSGCGLDNETISLKIKNNGANPISGGLTASFQRQGAAVVTETVTALIGVGDTLNYTFNSKINLSSPVDTNYLVKVWVNLVGDPTQSNDTVANTIASKVALPDPVVTSPTIPYGTSTTLTASHANPLNWYSDPLAMNVLVYGSSYTTPILFDTTTYYVQAMATGGGAFFITEVAHYKVTTGAPPGGWPPYLLADDYIEITGVPNSDLGGYTLEQWSTTALTSSHTFPPGTILGPNGTAIIAVGQLGSSSVPVPASYYYHGNGTYTGSFSSTTGAGRILKSPTNTIVDAVGYATYTFPAASGVTAQDWSGNTPSVSSSGNRLVGPDVNSATNWINSGTSPQDPNVLNSGVMLPTSTGCPSKALPVVVSVGAVPLYNAGITTVLSPTGAYTAGAIATVTVELKNFALDTLKKVRITYSRNGLVRPDYIWTGSLAYNQTTTVTLGTDSISIGATNFKAWTSLPNDSLDGYLPNDTSGSLAYTCLSGTFTLGDASSDFPNFAALQTVLGATGLCGPTTIRIKPGTYAGPFTIPAITGSSSVNRLTFESFSGLNTDVVIQHSGTSAANNWTIRLDGADYLTFRNLTIRNNGSSFGRVVEVINGATYNILEGNRLISGGASTSTTSCVYDGTTLNHYNTYLNNYMSGGYYTIYCTGASTSSWQKGTVIQGNEIVGSYYYPMYVYYHDSVQIVNNYVHDGVSTYSYGISAYYINNAFRITGNRIEMVAATTTATYGIREAYGNNVSYNANPSAYGVVANNMISINVNTAGTHYGLYAYYSSGTRVYYNNVNIYGVTATASRALHQANTTTNIIGHQFRNNNWINNAGGYAAYFTTITHVAASDYNNYRSTGAALTYWGAAQATLAAHRTASGMDANSLNVDPLYVSNLNLHTTSMALNGAATPVAEVTVDFDGESRSASAPDLGADEMPLVPNDLSLFAVRSPESGCGLDSAEVKIVILNNGPVTVNAGFSASYQLNGSTTVISQLVPVSVAALDSLVFTFSQKVNLTTAVDSTFILRAWVSNPGDPIQLNDTLSQPVFNGGVPPVPVYSNVSTTYGSTATLTATATGQVWWYAGASATMPIALGASYTTPILFDTTVYYLENKASNGCVSPRVPDTVFVTNIPPVDLAISRILVDEGCRVDSAEQVTIEIYNQGYSTVSSGITASFRVDNNPWVSPEPVNLTIAPNDTVQYTFTATANLYAYVADTMFKVRAWVANAIDTYTLNDTLLRDSVEVNYTPPAPIVVSPIFVPYASPVTLNVIGNDTILWFASDTSTIPFAGGQSYTTPMLFDTTTYWVAQGGNSSVGGLSYFTTLAAGNSFAGNMFDITPNSLVTLDSFDLNIIAGSAVAELYYRTGSYVPYTNDSTGWIKVGSANVTGLGTGLPTRAVFNKLTLPPGQTYGLYITLTAGTMYYTNITQGLTVYDTDFTLMFGQGGGYPFSLANPGRQWNGRIYYSKGAPGCESERVPVVVNVGAPPPVDAGVQVIVSPSGVVNNAVPIPVQVQVRNYGTDTLTSVTLNYQIGATVSAPFVWNNISLAPGTISQPVTIGSETFSGGAYSIRAWTSMPNNVQDTSNFNDTTSSQNFFSCLSGSYTLGGSGSDFPTFASALSALNVAGVCGPVVFNVQDGFYNERLTITSITGASAINTITFQGNPNDSTAVELETNGIASANWTIRLDGADYFTFRNMSISNLDVTNSRVVELANGAHYNSFIGNHMVSGGTGSASAAVIYDGNTLNHYNSYIGNYMQGGYYGIYVYGVSTSSWKKGTIIQNNELVGSGLYPIYVYYADSVQVIGNHVHSGVGASSNGISVYYTNNAYRIIGNIVDIVSTGTTASYGMRDYYCNYYSYNAAPSGYGLVANNMISIRGSGTATNYGIYAYYSSGTRHYHNTVNVSAGSTTAYGLYYLNTTSNTQGLTFINNVYMSLGYAAYYSTVSMVAASDFNCYYGSGANFVYWGSAYPNLAALKTATPGFNQNSVSVLPDFFSNSNLYLQSTSLSGLGTAIAAVPFDIDGEPRSQQPTLGADEVKILAIDAGVAHIYRPFASENEATIVPVAVRLRNFGTNALTSIPVSYSVAGTSITGTATWTGNLASQDTAFFVLPNMTVPAGNRQICVETQIPGDSNTFNNKSCKAFFGVPMQDALLSEIVEIEGGCGLGLDTVILKVKNIGYQSIPGGFTAKYKEEDGASVYSATVSQSILPGDSILINFPTLFDFSVGTTDSMFRIIAWVDVPADNNRLNDTASMKVNSLHIPAAPITNASVSVPYATPATLTATSPTSEKLYWYDSDTAQTFLDSGSVYATPLMYAQDTFYVAARSSIIYGAGQGSTVNIAPLATANASICNTGACSTLNDLNFGTCGTQQMWITTASPPDTTPGVNFIDFTWPITVSIGKIRIHHAQDNARFLKGARVQVWSGSGWIDHFWFDNLPMQCINEVVIPPVATTVLRLTSFKTGPIGQLSNPNFREIEIFEGSVPGCESARVPIVINVGAKPPYDAGVLSLNTPTTAVNLSASEPVNITLRNFGYQSVSNLQVNYQVNNLAVISETITNTLNSGDTLNYTFQAQANLSSPGVNYQIKAWTSLPGDTTAINDTAYTSVTNLIPNYCICEPSSALNLDITRVKVANLNNTSTAVGTKYSDFTALNPALLSIGTTDSLTVSSDFVSSTTQNAAWVNVFIDWNRDGVFDPATELAFSDPTTSQNTVADTFSVPTNAKPGLTRMRVVLRQGGTAANTGPCGVFTTYGEVEDYTVQVQTLIANDAGVLAITSPGATVSGGVQVPVSAVVRNYGSQPILPGQLQVKFQLDNSPVFTVTVQSTLQSFDTLTVSAGNWPVPIGLHQLCVWTELANDSNTFNDQKCMGVFGELYTTLPYADNFEGVVYWNAAGLKGNWQHGVPAGTTINTAHSPTKVWKTKLSGYYDNGANELLYTPRFNFAGLLPTDTATLKFWHWYATETANDGGQLQYSVNGGQTWITLGTIGDPDATNWYVTNIGGSHVFSGSSSGWVQSTIKLNPAVFNGQSLVQFRFRFFSNATTNSYDGWAIDDFAITLPMQPNDVGVDAIVSPPGGSIIGSQVMVTVTLKNFGSNTQTSFPVAYKVNNLPPVTETWIGSLASNATSNFTFTVPYTSPNTAYQLCAYTALPNDAFTANDQECASQAVLPAPFDVGVVEITNPKDSVCRDSWQKPVIVKVVNFGTSAVTSMPIQYQLNVASPVIETWNGSLLPGDTMVYQFSTLFIPPIGVFMMCAQTNLSLDANSANNKTCNTVKSVICLGIDENGLAGMDLGQNRPNPASDLTQIDITLPGDGNLLFEVVNLLGQVVESKQIAGVAGTQTIELNLANLESGVYYYSIRFNGYSLTRKMVIE